MLVKIEILGMLLWAWMHSILCMHSELTALTLAVNAGKLILVNSLLAAKEATGKTFTQISKEIGLTNAYTAQLFYNQVTGASTPFGM